MRPLAPHLLAPFITLDGNTHPPEEMPHILPPGNTPSVWLTALSVAITVVVMAYAAHAYTDIRRRRKVFEDQGMIVLSQPLHFAGVFANLLPTNRWGLWLCPYRVHRIDEVLAGLFERNDANLIAFVSFGAQQVFTKYPLPPFPASFPPLLDDPGRTGEL